MAERERKRWDAVARLGAGKLTMGQDVEQEAPEEFEAAVGDASALLRGEANGLGGEALQAVIGESGAVGVAAEVTVPRKTSC